MDHSLNEALSREDIWIWLSMVYCLSIRHYSYIAMHLTKINLDELENIFFTEVAPQCYSPLPPAPDDHWEFDEKHLVESIKKRLAARKSSFLRRIAGDLYIKYLKKACASDWQAFKKAYYSELSRKA
ncbi:MAG: hypothetical protein WAP08_04915 [Smithellaceae bacterium]|jgi:hypothetical protein